MHIGQVIMSIRTKAQNKEHVVEALRRAKFKFPGRQKVLGGVTGGLGTPRGCLGGSLRHPVHPRRYWGRGVLRR